MTLKTLTEVAITAALFAHAFLMITLAFRLM